MKARALAALLVAIAGCEADVASSEPAPETPADGSEGRTEGDDVLAETTWTCPSRPLCSEDYCDQVLIPEGEFPMGFDSPPPDSYWPAGDERPVHAVRLGPYCIDRYEVTLERYEACVDAGVCPPDGLTWRKADHFETTVNHYPDECAWDLDLCWDHAVNAKNYYQARIYCEWIGGRLCTEAEWERAANGPGPEKRMHPWGDGPPTTALCNIPSTGPGYVEEVSSHPSGASPEGVFNLAGNVYEWVRDAYAPYEPAPDGGALVDPLVLPASAGAEVVGRGSCFFTEPTRTTTERSRFQMAFDWG